jgi:ribosomal protein S18 acetylase RimI-like enzyme
VTPGRFHVSIPAMLRPPIATRPATPADLSLASGILSRAFIDDPAMCWLLPDRAGRPQRLQALFGAITRLGGDPALWTLAGNEGAEPAAVALWKPPGAWQTPFLQTMTELPALLRAFGLGTPRALGLQTEMERHHPKAPHWYLQFVGCSPEEQGRGFGGAVIRDRLAVCDRDGVAAALETATPSNVPLYEALGFRVTETFTHKDGPQFWDMWRDPR